MDTKKIATLAGELEKARSALESLEYEASLLNLSGHQQNISVRIGEKGRSFSLSELDHRRTYAAIAVRGTEMVMLGVKKLYAARVDEMKQHVGALEARIAREAVK